METLNNQPVEPAETLPPTAPPASKGLAIASMVLGIISVVTGLFYVGAILGLLAIIFGIIALKKKTGKGMAITGIITGSGGVLATILAITLVIIAIPALQAGARDTERKEMLAQVKNDIAKWQLENQGQLPDPVEFSQSYKTRSFTIAASGEPTTSTAIYKVGVSCDGTTREGAFSVTVKLENGRTDCLPS